VLIDGKYEEVLSSELCKRIFDSSVKAESESTERTHCLAHVCTCEQVHFQLSNTGFDDEISAKLAALSGEFRESALLVLGVAHLYAFMQQNWTGPLLQQTNEVRIALCASVREIDAMIDRSAAWLDHSARCRRRGALLESFVDPFVRNRSFDFPTIR
jgi:hypothetical protein